MMRTKTERAMRQGQVQWWRQWWGVGWQGQGWRRWGGGDRGRDRDDEGDGDDGNTTTTTMRRHNDDGVSMPAWQRQWQQWCYAHGQCHGNTTTTTPHQHGEEFTHNDGWRQITMMTQCPGWLVCECFAHWPACTLCWRHAPTEAHQWWWCPCMANATMACRRQQYVVQRWLEAQSILVFIYVVWLVYRVPMGVLWVDPCWVMTHTPMWTTHTHGSAGVGCSGYGSGLAPRHPWVTHVEH